MLYTGVAEASPIIHMDWGCPGRLNGPGHRIGFKMPVNFITFLSDFGYTDDFVGTCHGVIKTIAPGVEIIDITHGVRRHDVQVGALILANTLAYMPESVILAVVDPGVGSGRRPLAILTQAGRYLVGPDNGLLSLAAEKLGGAAEAVELACSSYSLPEVCKTFEGRDLFAPVAAHISLGVGLASLGTPIELQGLMQIELPAPIIKKGAVTATVVYIDRFGNVQLNLKRRQLEEAGARAGSPILASHDQESWLVPFVYTYADVEPENLLVFEDSYHNISFSVNQGSAAHIFQIQVGDEMKFSVPD